jgi:hypothetical protein
MTYLFYVNIKCIRFLNKITFHINPHISFYTLKSINIFPLSMIIYFLHSPFHFPYFILCLFKINCIKGGECYDSYQRIAIWNKCF